ncbi:MAG: hypothetical protein ACM3TN_16615 [Alphaproteobacteria bacterium]
MLLAIGFLFGCLLGLAAVPLVHERAVRLTVKRLNAALPQSQAEIRAQKDLLRAEFAMNIRRLELDLERHREKSAKLLVRGGKNSDVTSRLKAECDTLKTEVMGLKMQIEALKKQPPATDTRPDARAYVVRQMSPRRILQAARR